MTVRCRFAPAPSGSIHVGNVRTGLFSWAFARHHGGAFVLRIEDTDASRVTEEAFHGVMDSLRWLGIDWDEGPDVGGPHEPYRQSQRMEIYREAAERLVSEGHAYRCYCTEAELEERRAAALARGDPPGYDGKCRSPEVREAFEAEGRPAAIRFEMPEREHLVHDLVKGDVRWAPGHLRDFVLMRSDGTPVFLLAVAVDDLRMGITHVIRGDDLLASAPAQRRRDRGARRHAARVRARPAGQRPRRQAAVQAARFDERRGVPRARDPAGGADELPRAARLVQGRRDDVPVEAGARRRVRHRARVAQPGTVRHREARVDEQPLHPVARGRRPRRAMLALPLGRRALARSRRCCGERCRS